MYKLIIGALIISAFVSCKSSTIEKTDSVYSRHLQRHVALTVIATSMPNKKEEMNLLLFNNSHLLETIHAKKIIDSLFKKKLIQPLTLVAFEGRKGDYGLEEINIAAAKQYKKFNEFVIGELYPFIKKKVIIRKFNSVAICGFEKTALSSFDIAWNNDDKIQKAGLFLPLFNEDAQITFETIKSLRKRPNIKFWITDNNNDSTITKLHEIISNKNNSTTSSLITAPSTSNELQQYNFAEFLLWAFPK